MARNVQLQGSKKQQVSSHYRAPSRRASQWASEVGWRADSIVPPAERPQNPPSKPTWSNITRTFLRKTRIGLARSLQVLHVFLLCFVVAALAVVVVWHGLLNCDRRRAVDTMTYNGSINESWRPTFHPHSQYTTTAAAAADTSSFECTFYWMSNTAAAMKINYGGGPRVCRARWQSSVHYGLDASAPKRIRARPPVFGRTSVFWLLGWCAHDVFVCVICVRFDFVELDSDFKFELPPHYKLTSTRFLWLIFFHILSDLP